MSRKAVDTRSRRKLSTRTMRLRLVLVFGAIVLCCLGLIVKIATLDSKKGDNYQKKVLAQQSYVSNVIPYRRGDISDRNGNKLATSKKVYNMVIDAKAMLADNKKYVSDTEEALQAVFNMSPSEVTKLVEKNPNSRYYVVKAFKGLSADIVETFNKKKEKNKNIQGVWFEPEYKRVYPYSTVACDVIGFCSSENTGAWGIENQYNSKLNGTYGRRYGYYDSDLNLIQTVKAATNGYNIKSTIDVNVQGILEQHIEKFMKKTGSKNFGCVMMNPNNGEIYAMASNPVYDLNNPRDLSSFYAADKIAAMTDKEKMKVLSKLWGNYCISDAYEPGSTFKPFTVAAALDEGVTSNTSVYNCDGGQDVNGTYIKCVAHSSGGHGAITVEQALMLSCNDVLMQLGAKLGKNTFLKYVNAYGFGRRTGVDLPGEATGGIFNSNTMHATELATSSFGQSQTVTMVQMAAGFSALVNGGNYYQPHVVKEVQTESGATVLSNDNALESKVITEKTSKLLRKDLLATVDEGTAAPAQVPGYKVGGKTGTAEKIPRGKGKYLVSFIGCVPADKPELIVYTVIDEPKVADQAHSTYATEFTSSLLKDVLPLLGIQPDKKSEAQKSKKLKLPSTVNGNSLYQEAPEGGYSDENYGVANTAAQTLGDGTTGLDTGEDTKTNDSNNTDGTTDGTADTNTNTNN